MTGEAEKGAEYTVIIPVFNRAATLERAVASAVAQTIAPAHILIVDDGSVDDSLSVARALAAKHAMIDVIPLGRNGGAPAARNHGALLADTALLAFLDSDDEWVAEKAERQIMALRQTTGYSPAAFTNIKFMWKARRPTRSFTKSPVRRSQLLLQNRIGSTSSAMVRRDAFTAAGGFRERISSCQDWDLWIRLASLGPLIVCDDALTIYHLDASNRISSDAFRVIRGQAFITSRLEREFRDERKRHRLRAAHALNIAGIFARQPGKEWRAIKWAARGLALSLTCNSAMRGVKVAVHASVTRFRHWRGAQT